MPEIILATHNRHKADEVSAILAPDFNIRCLADFTAQPPPEETGNTFEENAAIKACAASAALGDDVWVLADDSGLEVDALGGAPGVHSALYSGRHGDDAGHRRKLLAELTAIGAVNPGRRRGRFRCVLALARGGTVVAQCSGTVEGTIAPGEAGGGGFGYDCLFVPDGHDRTFGELPPSVKNALSHRARALAEFREMWGALAP